MRKHKSKYQCLKCGGMPPPLNSQKPYNEDLGSFQFLKESDYDIKTIRKGLPLYRLAGEVVDTKNNQQVDLDYLNQIIRDAVSQRPTPSINVNQGIEAPILNPAQTQAAQTSVATAMRRPSPVGYQTLPTENCRYINGKLVCDEDENKRNPMLFDTLNSMFEGVTNLFEQKPQSLFDSTLNSLPYGQTSYGDIRTFKKGGQPSPEKAREMLHNPPHGKKLTEKQRKYFGWLANKEGGGYFKSEEDRNTYRQRLTQVANEALTSKDDTKYLSSLSGLQKADGTDLTWDDNENCINGICGLNIQSGLKYNTPSYKDRYIGNTSFSDAVNGNFQVGDHLQYINKKGSPFHSKIIYDSYTDPDGNKKYKIIHNGGGKDFSSEEFSESDLKRLVSNQEGDRVLVNRPGYTLDKPKLEIERQPASPEALKAMQNRKNQYDSDLRNAMPWMNKLREGSEYANTDNPVLSSYFDFSNNPLKRVDLAEKLGVPVSTLDDELLNTFGELGQESKFGTSKSPEYVFEKLFKPKGKSIGPGQIRFSALSPELREMFQIEKAKDLFDPEKVVPLMTAINVRNRQYMERKGDDLSELLIGEKGVSADELRGGVGRWTPYMYRGSLRNPKKQAQNSDEPLRTFQKNRDEGSYPDKVFDVIDQNLERYSNLFNAEHELPNVEVVAPKKQMGGWGTRPEYTKVKKRKK
jgi:hypothetical protein